jgi:hypothetical protein
MSVEHAVGTRFGNVIRWVRAYFLIVLCYIGWVACAFVIIPRITVDITVNGVKNEWIELAWWGWIIIIPFFFLPLSFSGSINKLMWTITSKKMHIKGFDFCVCRGPAKNVKKEIIPGIKDARFPDLDINFETQDYGTLSQFGLEGPFDVIYPEDCMEDDGVECQIVGVPSWYAPEDLPQPIRSRYVRERVDPLTGETYYETLRKKKGVCLVVPAVNPVTGEIVGANFLHSENQLQQQQINNLEKKLRRAHVKYDEDATSRDADTGRDSALVPGR